MKNGKLLAVLLAAGLIFTAGCKKDEESPTAVMTTTAVTEIGTTTATSGGSVDGVGSSSVTERGVCWSESENPTTSGSKTSDGTGTGTFTSHITGLFNSTTYHVRSYAVSGGQTVYGPDVTFETSAPIQMIVNGDFSSPDDATTTINDVAPWKTDGPDDGSVVGRSKEGSEYLVWQSQNGTSYYQTVGSVPSVETEYSISLDGRVDWTYWGDYNPRVAVRFSAYSGSDPTARVQIGSAMIEFAFANMYSWETGKTADFTLTEAKATEFEGQHLVIEFKVLNALEAYEYGGFDDADVWLTWDKLSVLQN